MAQAFEITPEEFEQIRQRGQSDDATSLAFEVSPEEAQAMGIAPSVSAMPEARPERRDPGFLANMGNLAIGGGQDTATFFRTSDDVATGRIDDDTARIFAEAAKRQQERYRPPELDQALGAFDESHETWAQADNVWGKGLAIGQWVYAFGREVVTNPEGVAYLSAEQVANMVPAWLGALAGAKTGGAAGAILGPKGAAAGAVIGGTMGAFGGGASIEAGAALFEEFMDEAERRGVMPTEENFAAFAQDQEWLDNALSRARKKAAATAGTDALLTMAGAKIASGAYRSSVKAARKELGEKASSEAVEAHAEKMLAERSVFAKAKRPAAGVAVGAVGEPTSELAGQVARGGFDEIDLTELGAEALGGIGPAVVETGSIARRLYKDSKPNKDVDLLDGAQQKGASATAADPEVYAELAELVEKEKSGTITVDEQARLYDILSDIPQAEADAAEQAAPPPGPAIPLGLPQSPSRIAVPPKVNPLEQHIRQPGDEPQMGQEPQQQPPPQVNLADELMRQPDIQQVNQAKQELVDVLGIAKEVIESGGTYADFSKRVKSGAIDHGFATEKGTLDNPRLLQTMKRAGYRSMRDLFEQTVPVIQAQTEATPIIPEQPAPPLGLPAPDGRPRVIPDDGTVIELDQRQAPQTQQEAAQNDLSEMQEPRPQAREEVPSVRAQGELTGNNIIKNRLRLVPTGKKRGRAEVHKPERIDASVRRTLESMRSEISDGEPGQRIPTGDGEFMGIPSTYPDYFKDKGFTKQQALAAIDNYLSGRGVTISDNGGGQLAVLESLFADKRKHDARQAWAYRQELQREASQAMLPDDSLAPMQYSHDDAPIDWDAPRLTLADIWAQAVEVSGDPQAAAKIMDEATDDADAARKLFDLIRTTNEQGTGGRAEVSQGEPGLPTTEADARGAGRDQSTQEPAIEKTADGDQYVLVEGEKSPIKFGSKPQSGQTVTTGDLMADMSGLEPGLFDNQPATPETTTEATTGSAPQPPATAPVPQAQEPAPQTDQKPVKFAKAKAKKAEVAKKKAEAAPPGKKEVVAQKPAPTPKAAPKPASPMQAKGKQAEKVFNKAWAAHEKEIGEGWNSVSDALTDVYEQIEAGKSLQEALDALPDRTAFKTAARMLKDAASTTKLSLTDGGQGTTEGGAGVETPMAQHIGRVVAQKLGLAPEKVTGIRELKPHAKGVIALTEAMHKLFGVRIAFVTGLGRYGADGAFDADAFGPNLLVVNLPDGGDVAPMRVMGHELLHALRYRNPILYRQFVASLARFMDAQQVIDYNRAYNNRRTGEEKQASIAYTLEEQMADFLGQKLLDNTFWQEMADLSPKKADVLRKVAQLFEGMIKKVKDYFAQTKTKDVSGLFDDLDVASNLLAQYVVGNIGAEAAAAYTESGTRLAARELETEGIKVTKTGKIVGAPPWAKTKGDILRIKNFVNTLATEGAEAGRYWYEDSGKAVLKMFNGNVKEATKFIQLLAIYSPQASVSANTTHALKALYQFREGKPIKVKTAVMDKKASDLLYDGKEDWTGIKTSTFFSNLMAEVDPKFHPDTMAQGATIDLWVARAMGYSNDIPSKEQFKFAETIIAGVAKSLGWPTHQVQAALWTAVKARFDAMPKQRKAHAKKGGKELFMALRRQQIDSAALAKSGYNYSNGIAERTAQISWEAQPGRNSGVLPGIFDAPLSDKITYMQWIEEAFVDEGGRDVLAQKLGLQADDTMLAPSAWEGEVAAGAQTFAPIDISTGVIPDATIEKLNQYAAIKGYVLHQDAVVWHYPVFKGGKRNHNGLDLNFGRPLTHEEMQAIYDRIIAVSGRQDLAPAATPTGVRILNFVDGLTNKDFHDMIAESLTELSVKTLDKPTVESFKSLGDYIGNDWEVNKNGEGYLSDRLGYSDQPGWAGLPDLQGWVKNELYPKILKVNERASKEFGWGNPGTKLSLAARHDRPAESGSQGAVGLPTRDGRVRLHHWSSQEGLTELDPAKYGTGLRGAEAKRKANNPAAWVDRTYFGVAEGDRAYVKEPGLGDSIYTVDVDAALLYDLAADPDGIMAKSQDWGRLDLSLYEKNIKEAGYEGYWRDDPSLGMVVAKFTPTALSDTRFSLSPEAEVKGFTDQLRKYRDKSINRRQPLVVGGTPLIYKPAEFDPLPVAITQETLDKIRSGKKGDRAPIGLDTLKRLPEYLHNPVAVFQSKRGGDDIVILTDMVDNLKIPVVVALRKNETVGRYDVNRVTSVYGKDRLNDFLRDEHEAKRLLFINKQKELAVDMIARLRLPGMRGQRQAQFEAILAERANAVNSQGQDTRLSLVDDAKAAFEHTGMVVRKNGDIVATDGTVVGNINKMTPWQRWKASALSKVVIPLDRLVDGVGRLPMTKEYLRIRRLSLGALDALEQRTREIYDLLKPLTQEQAKATYDFFTTKEADASKLPTDKRQQIVEIKKGIIQIGRDLVDRGLLPQEALDVHEDSYLPRRYLKYLLKEDGTAVSGASKGLRLDYARQRKDIARKIRENVLGEVTDPAYLAARANAMPMRDIILYDFLEKIMMNPNWALPASLVDYSHDDVPLRSYGGLEYRQNEDGTYDLFVTTNRVQESRFDDVEAHNLSQLIDPEVAKGILANQGKPILVKKGNPKQWAIGAWHEFGHAKYKQNRDGTYTVKVKERKTTTRQAKGVEQSDLGLHLSQQQIDAVLEGKGSLSGGRKMTPLAMMAEADRLQKMALDVPTERRAEVERLATKMRERATEVINQIKRDKKIDLLDPNTFVDEWRQIPNTMRYGSLRGMLVRKEIFDDLIGNISFMLGERGVAARFLAEGGHIYKAHGMWKWTKTVANVSTHFRNFYSNMILMQIAGGVPVSRVPYYYTKAAAEVFARHRKGAPETYKHYALALKYGLGKSTFSDTEMGRIETDFLDMLRRTSDKQGLGWFVNTAKFWGAQAYNKSGDIYQLNEAIGKTAVMMYQMEKGGMNADQASHVAHKALFDYSLVSPSIKYLRQFPYVGMPFVTFSAKMLPRIAETALTKPWRLAPWVALHYGLLSFAATMMFSGGEDEDNMTTAEKMAEIDKLKKTLMESMRDKKHMYFLPKRDESDRWQLADLGYIFPWTPWAEAASGLTDIARLDVESGVPKILAPMAIGGPVTDVVTALMTGKDAFTKRDIVSPDSVYLGEKAADIATWLWGVAAPPFVADKGPLAKMWNADDVDILGNPRQTPEQIVARMFGINVYAINPEITRDRNVKRMLRKMEEVEYFGTQRYLGKAQTPERKEKFKRDMTKKLNLMADEIKQYIEDSDIHPDLRTIGRGKAIQD